MFCVAKRGGGGGQSVGGVDDSRMMIRLNIRGPVVAGGGRRRDSEASVVASLSNLSLPTDPCRGSLAP
jgi:hypothetical protein